jgi:hypothetical protein
MGNRVPEPETIICENCGSDVAFLEADESGRAGWYEVCARTSHENRYRNHAMTRCLHIQTSGKPWRTPERYERC